MCHPIHFFSYRGWFSKKLIWFIWSEHWSRPRCVNGGINYEISSMYAFWSKFTRYRFRKNTLRGLRRSKKPQFVLPRVADVLPVIRIAPLPASIIAGNVSRARCNKAVVFTLKFLSRSSGSNSRMLPLTLLNAL